MRSVAPQIVNVSEFYDDVIQNCQEEVCGIIVNNRYIRCDNIAETKNNSFKIRGRDINEYYITGQLQGVLHSHVEQQFYNGVMVDQRAASLVDMTQQQAMQVPWGIVATDGENVTDIKWLGAYPDKLELRPYIPGIYDCFSLVRDYYFLEKNIDLPDYAHGVDWTKTDAAAFEDNFRKFNFEEVINKQYKKGDVLLFKSVRGDFVSHCGIFIDDNTFFHHQLNKFSQYDFLPKWQKRIYKVLQYK